VSGFFTINTLMRKFLFELMYSRHKGI